MKNILLVLFSLLSFSLSAQIVGGGGRCHVIGNPNSIAGIAVQDLRYGCLEAVDTITGTVWKYVTTNTSGSKWVIDVNPIDSIVIVPQSKFINPISPTIGEVEKHIADEGLPIGTTLTYSPPITDSKQRVNIRKNENYNAFPVLMKGSKGELFCYLRVGAGHITDGDAVIFKSTDGGVSWDSVNVANYTGSAAEYGYGAGTIFERNDTIFATYQATYFTGALLDSASCYWKYSIDRGSTWNGGTWISKPYANTFRVGESKAVVLPSGKVVFSVYGFVGATTTVKVATIPANGGFSDITYVDIPNGFGSESETCLIADGDTLIAFIRQEAGGSMNRSISLDEGATWSNPTTINVFPDYRPVYPQAELLPDGRIIMGARDTITNMYLSYAISEDKGLTWDGFRMESEVPSAFNNSQASMYMDFELLTPTTIGAVYSVERIAGDSRGGLEIHHISSAFKIYLGEYKHRS